MWQEHLREAEAACRSTLEEPAFRAVTGQMGGRYAEVDECLTALSQNVSVAPAAMGDHAAEPHSLERWLLMQGALAALPRIAKYPVCDEVKALWADEAIFIARPPAAWLSSFTFGKVCFQEMAKIVTLRRFPAGQFHWELSGLPRSYLLRTPYRKWPKTLAYVLGRMGGFAPMAETHVNDRRKNRLTLTAAEGAKSYYLLAKSLELQPEVRGLFAAGWLICESTAMVSPHLSWVREFLLDNGALVASIGPAPADSGFLVGGGDRRRLYEQGRYRPQMTYAIWSRRLMLEWAKHYERLGGGAWPLGFARQRGWEHPIE